MGSVGFLVVFSYTGLPLHLRYMVVTVFFVFVFLFTGVKVSALGRGSLAMLASTIFNPYLYLHVLTPCASWALHGYTSFVAVFIWVLILSSSSSSHLSSMGVDVCGSTTADFGHLPRVARVCVHASSTYVPLYRLARYELVQSEPSAAASSTGRFHVGLAARAVLGHAGWHVGSPQCNL